MIDFINDKAEIPSTVTNSFQIKVACRRQTLSLNYDGPATATITNLYLLLCQNIHLLIAVGI